MPLIGALEETMVAEVGPHRPVLLRETLESLRPQPGAVIVDATLGPGGHAEAVLQAIGPGGRLYGIDRDSFALRLARQRLARYGDRFVPIHGNHRDLTRLLHDLGVEAVDGFLADLGVSSLQLDDPARGFALRLEGPLDMRMDPETGPTAADLLATLPEGDLAEILFRYGEERRARAIARTIVRERAKRPLRTTTELAELVTRVAGPSARRFRIHPATRTFQALRIAVNREIEGLDRLVDDAAGLLRRGGRLVFISFHSLEDRAVKNALRALAHRCTCPPDLPVCACGRESLIRVLTSRPIRPTEEEVSGNPRARSARMRAGEKL
jgi:16S rRNA (cytosine1402-N4)-methyltransferase